MGGPKKRLPAWYHRVSGITMMQDRDVYPWEFDQDLSDIEEPKPKESKPKERSKYDYPEYDGDPEAPCECGAGEECEGHSCECPAGSDCGGHTEDEESEESEYDAEQEEVWEYRDLQEQRENRKKELKEQAEQKDEERAEARSWDVEMQKKVQTAYEAYKNGTIKGNTPQHVASLAGKQFSLHCVDYIDHFPNDFTKSAKFEKVEDGTLRIAGGLNLGFNGYPESPIRHPHGGKP
ncbi:hypothetical protein B0J13DRAFT_63505 [Dactylonectria estremocensis]|uniref:Uncharacterized protein n=1 Tax=Dactylonectria estremocensis TaxID=1079267 RepID=A0A9P9EMG4_9HYPO|nr:hypothetical protein B0J13DRAFT_63505 [Dactylonectria estremocensis]